MVVLLSFYKLSLHPYIVRVMHTEIHTDSTQTIHTHIICVMNDEYPDIALAFTVQFIPNQLPLSIFTIVCLRRFISCLCCALVSHRQLN